MDEIAGTPPGTQDIVVRNTAATKTVFNSLPSPTMISPAADYTAKESFAISTMRQIISTTQGSKNFLQKLSTSQSAMSKVPATPRVSAKAILPASALGFINGFAIVCFPAVGITGLLVGMGTITLAAIPVVGWAILGGALLVGGIIGGVAAGYAAYKKAERKAVLQECRKANDLKLQEKEAAKKETREFQRLIDQEKKKNTQLNNEQATLQVTPANQNHDDAKFQAVVNRNAELEKRIQHLERQLEKAKLTPRPSSSKSNLSDSDAEEMLPPVVNAQKVNKFNQDDHKDHTHDLTRAHETLYHREAKPTLVVLSKKQEETKEEQQNLKKDHNHN